MVRTYILIGNTDNWPQTGMNKDRWETDLLNSYTQGRYDGSVETEWQIGQGSATGDQVVLLRTGASGVPGIIGFGLRSEGEAIRVGIDQQYPVRFYNIRSVEEEPFIRTNVLVTTKSIKTQRNEGRQHTYYNTKRPPLETDELSNLDGLCKERLGVSLSIMCSEPMAERFVPGGSNEVETSDQKALLYVQNRDDLDSTTKKRLIAARNGQGVFRDRVMLTEPSCRVTGVSDPVHLRASHIRPWKDSNDFERLDRNNGLMLAPHVDHLFDRGYITFDLNGVLLVSHDLAPDLAECWNLRQNVKPKEFSNQQEVYLAYHRINCFLD